jgi:DNA-binding NarL/FixJ family response regulator
MARVLALVPDLMFGSRLQSALQAAGDELQLVASEPPLRARLADESLPAPEVVIVDLTDEQLDGAGVVESLLAAGLLGGARTLGFYSHVDAAARERAERAGFDLVVPRSRMARETAALVARLA